MSDTKSHRQLLYEFEDKLKEIGIEVGGAAVLRKKNNAGYVDYVIVEHPTEQRYIVNKDLFYNQPLDIVDGAELVSKIPAPRYPNKDNE